LSDVHKSEFFNHPRSERKERVISIELFVSNIYIALGSTSPRPQNQNPEKGLALAGFFNCPIPISVTNKNHKFSTE